MSTVLLGFPGQYTPRFLLEGLPVRELAHLFWMAFVAGEEKIRRTLEGHAWTAWWVHKSIEFAEGAEHSSWDEWAQMRGIRWRNKPAKTRADLVAEINAKFDKAFNPNLRFAPMPVERESV